jgi:hypothetical protein
MEKSMTRIDDEIELTVLWLCTVEASRTTAHIMPPTVQELKAEAKALFIAGDFVGAAKLYSDAIRSPAGKKDPAL